MLTSKEIYRNIDRIVDRAYLGFTILLLGVDVLTDEQKIEAEALGLIVGQRPLIELLYILVRNRPHEGYAKDTTLARLLDQLSPLLPVISDAQQSTLDTAKASMLETITSTRDDLKKELKQRVVEANRVQRQNVAVNRVGNPAEVSKQKDSITSLLLGALPFMLMKTEDSFDRSFASGMTDFVNDAIVDSLTMESIMTGESTSSRLVYKVVKNDGHLCQWCEKFYVEASGEPKLYTLAELQANGSNYGKLKSEWLPVLGKTHPRCRCVLYAKSDKTSQS